MGGEKVRTRIDQNCRAVCTKLMPQAIAKDALSNDRHESAVHFKRPAEQALVPAIEPRAKQEARSVLCDSHTCQ